VHNLTSDRGIPVYQHSRGNYGTYVFGYSDGFGAVGIKAVTLDDESWVETPMEAYTASTHP